ncbi:MAG: type I DNA topoisomerase [Sphingomonadales bacterium]
MDVVIVESPAKAKTINRYLGPGYKVLASYGHVRDLPPKDGSVRPDADFEMDWEVQKGSDKRLKDIADAVKGAEHLYLATDPDREGEAISWHVLEVLRQKRALKDVDVKRVVFNEITKNAVRHAMAHPRDLHHELIEAYLARRALDYLVGFTLSPVLWRKLPGARSAGRVQSVALRLIVDREMEIEAFQRQEYWTIEVGAETPAGEAFAARLTHLNGKKLDKFDLPNTDVAEQARATVAAAAFAVSAVEAKPTRRNPPPPFITSTLQQEAARKLGFAAARTMQLAQRLYEGITLDGETTGLITYMRTDGVQMAQEAIAGARDVIADRFGRQYMPEQPRYYKSKAKNAQEAHEAIRPTVMARAPETLARFLDRDQLRLYELIWNRAVACQMAAAEIERTSVDIQAEDGSATLRATGQVVTFGGFLKLYQEGIDDPEDNGGDAMLPAMQVGMRPSIAKVEPVQHFTEPPPRFSEASLVKKLEELGIGRPSTYASILSVLRDRNYVRMDKNRFVPEDKGRLVTAFLEKFFERYVEYDFTAGLEERLDDVSAGKADWKAVLRDFWHDFYAKTEEALGLKPSDVIAVLDQYLGPYLFKTEEAGGDARACPNCGDGKLSLKGGRYGPFVGCSNYPECRYTRPFSADAAALPAQDRVLGNDPETGLEVTLKSGRFGPYVQLGEGGEGEKPKRASLPKDVPADALDFDMALALLNLPREVGVHPETGEPIAATIGRFGPYLSHAGKTARLASTEDVLSIGLNRAVAVLAEAKPGKGRGPAELRTLGDHPQGGAVKLMDGRYGPYVTHDKVNASLPKDMDPDSLTLDTAVELLAARKAKGGGKAARRAKPVAKSKSATKAKTASKAKGTAKKKAPSTKKT